MRRYLSALRDFVLLVAVASAGAAGSGCKEGGGSPPSIVNPGPQVVAVGEKLTFDLIATDPDGDTLEYGFVANGVPDLASTTSVVVLPDGQAVFTMEPLASQVGTHIFDFSVSDGDNETRTSITIEIAGATNSLGGPTFKRPLSQGTVLDLETATCTSFEIEVEDPDSSSVTLGQAPPVIQNSVLSTTGGLTGTWEWCPDRDQRSGNDQWSLTLSADDGDNPPAKRDFVVVLRKPSGAGCPGEFPDIQHEVADFNTVLDLEIIATVTDDRGLSNPPLVLYAYESPGNPVQFEKLNNVATMEQQSGSPQNGTWRATIPNPVATEPEGSSASVWYIIQATDDDDAIGDCDHRQDAPPFGSYEIRVTNSGEGGASLCAGCSHDAQCGLDGDLCLTDGAGDKYCSQSCADEDCPTGYACTIDVPSVDGAQGDQCVPNGGRCEGGNGGTCEDDGADDGAGDDDPTAAAMFDPIDAGDYSAVLCPDDEDWWFFQVVEEAEITATLSGPGGTDIDIDLTGQSGALIKQSVGLTSEESLTTGCQAPGDYFLRVYEAAALSTAADYQLGLAFDTSECGTAGGDSCCAVHSTPGCSNASVQECVCADDPYCCGLDMAGMGTWDMTCVNKVGDLGCAMACP